MLKLFRVRIGAERWSLGRIVVRERLVEENFPSRKSVRHCWTPLDAVGFVWAVHPDSGFPRHFRKLCAKQFAALNWRRFMVDLPDCQMVHESTLCAQVVGDMTRSLVMG